METIHIHKYDSSAPSPEPVRPPTATKATWQERLREDSVELRREVTELVRSKPSTAAVASFGRELLTRGKNRLLEAAYAAFPSLSALKPKNLDGHPST